MSLSLAERRENAHAHAVLIAELLGRPSVKTIPQRIFRARLWLEMTPADLISEASHEYVVMTLVQNTAQSRVALYVTRPFTQATGAASTTKLELSGAYSPDEIVAFLCLDRVPSEHIDWRDETGSDLVRVPASIIDSYRE